MRIGDGASINFPTSISAAKSLPASAATDGFASLLFDRDETAERPMAPASNGPRATWGATDSGASAANDAVTQEFLDWMKKDPMERLRAQILESMNLDEASLAALPPEEREAIEAQIREAIEQAFGVGDQADAAESDEAGQKAQPAA